MTEFPTLSGIQPALPKLKEKSPQELGRTHTASSPHPELSKSSVYQARGEIAEILKRQDSLIVVAPTGTGKTTGLPIGLRDVFGDVAVVVTQPRRNAADGVAKRVAELTDGKKVGNLVGLRHRGANLVNEEVTRILFEVEGSLLNELKEDPTLGNYDFAIVDEVHERGINTDLTLALLKRAQSTRRTHGMKPLKIIVTSATLDAEKLSGYLDKAPVYNVEKPPAFKINMHWSTLDYPPEEMPHQAAKIVTDEIFGKGKTGDTLIFMPGKGEIAETQAAIEAAFAKHNIDTTKFEILTLDASSPESVKEEINNKKTDKTRIIIATNVAETSVTYPVRYVIDSGKIRQNILDPVTGIEMLEVIDHSQSGDKQRWGRVGRTEDGDVWTLFTQKNYESRSPYQIPEIQRTDLTATTLILKNLGLDPSLFDYIDKPNGREIDNAIKSLKILDALDESGNITSIGKEMADLPVDPHLSRMLVAAKEENCQSEAATIAAVFTNYEDLFTGKWEEIGRAIAPFRNGESDFLTMLNIWTEYENNRDKPEWIEKMHLNRETLRKIDYLRRDLTDKETPKPIGAETLEKLKRCISLGFADRLIEFSHSERTHKLYQWIVHPNISDISISNRSVLTAWGPKFLITGNISKNKAYEMIFAQHCQVVKDTDPIIAKIKEKIKSLTKLPEKATEKATEKESPPTKPAAQKEEQVKAEKPAEKKRETTSEEISPVGKENIFKRILRALKKLLAILFPLNWIRWFLQLFKKKKKEQ